MERNDRKKKRMRERGREREKGGGAVQIQIQNHKLFKSILRFWFQYEVCTCRCLELFHCMQLSFNRVYKVSWLILKCSVVFLPLHTIC